MTDLPSSPFAAEAPSALTKSPPASLWSPALTRIVLAQALFGFGWCLYLLQPKFLTQELARAVGLGGRDRTFSSPAERARISVTKAIRTAIRLIDAECPALAGHLETSIQTGRFCSYATPGAPPPAWSF